MSDELRKAGTSRSRRPAPKKRPRLAKSRPLPVVSSARLNSHIAIEIAADGGIAASFGGYAIPLGRLSAPAARRAQELRIGLPIKSFSNERSAVEKEIGLLV